MAIVGSFAIGTSSVITKMLGVVSNSCSACRGLTASADGTAATENMSFLRNSMWWAGMGCLYVTPLGALSVIVGAIFASFLLNEQLGHLGRVGCALCILGSSIIVLHAPNDQDLETVTQFLEYALEPGFLLYCFTVSVFSLVLAYGVAPRHGRTNPLVYISIASLVGSVSVMFVKGFTVALKLSFDGHNQFVYPSTYLFLIISAFCIVVQLNYANKALDLFSVNLYVGFCSATIVSTHTSPSNTVSLLAGFVVTFLGVHILNLAMLEESNARATAVYGEEEGIGMGLDGWTFAPPLFGAFALDPNDVGASSTDMRLHRLSEEEEEDEDADERTALSRRASPMPSPAPGGNARGESGLGHHHHNIRILPRPV
ncbi:magnesium transporter NIPA-domain-containing protein [Favolaschia claudopus]|uniref:Magnesium transporter NIPA-domain-containing protein n=1 Tax=Favolaschia claudopus TaxID=2862362 RepID=A0AAW0AC14_9AGAR